MAECPFLSVALTLAPAAISSSIIALCSPRLGYIWKAPRQAYISAVLPSLYLASISISLAPSRCFTTIAFPRSHAIISAVSPWLFLLLTLAPTAISFSTTPSCPAKTACLSAVPLSLSMALTSAPASINWLIADSHPLRDASISGFVILTLTSTPASSNICNRPSFDRIFPRPSVTIEAMSKPCISAGSVWLASSNHNLRSSFLICKHCLMMDGSLPSNARFAI